ncbi:hypothetical protein [Spiroplasma sp. AdecLV25b]|uniref:hypothetical protein n=1 Tax=Spiroplasma sp. AdecLV25b TaxID=3027162 RepID=UPI0027DF8918|nr:hypothetical protein [Spiroplasma sp. AdecLV25b]
MKDSDIKVIYNEWQKLYPEYKSKLKIVISYEKKKVEQLLVDTKTSSNKIDNKCVKAEEKVRVVDRKIWNVIWNEYKKQNGITDNICNEVFYNEWCEQIMEKIYSIKPKLKSSIFLIDIITTSFVDISRDESFKKDSNWEKGNTNNTSNECESQIKEYSGTWTQIFEFKYYQNKAKNLEAEKLGKFLNIFLLFFSLDCYNHNQRKDRAINKIKEKIEKLPKNVKLPTSTLSTAVKSTTRSNNDYIKTMANTECNSSSSDNTVKNSTPSLS